MLRQRQIIFTETVYLTCHIFNRRDSWLNSDHYILFTDTEYSLRDCLRHEQSPGCSRRTFIKPGRQVDSHTGASRALARCVNKVPDPACWAHGPETELPASWISGLAPASTINTSPNTPPSAAQLNSGCLHKSTSHSTLTKCAQPLAP